LGQPALDWAQAGSRLSTERNSLTLTTTLINTLITPV